MSVAVLREKEEIVTTPHWSHSRVQKYLACPEQYRLYYVEGLRSRIPSANLVFGQVVHQALAQLFQTGSDPAAFFTESWENLKQIELSFGFRESWEKLAGIGRALLEKFAQEELHRFGKVIAVEKSFTLSVTTLGAPFVGIIDFVGEVHGKRTILDFKTSASTYATHEAILSDQLTAYELAEPEVDQAALCVLVKTKEPKIEWFFSRRSPEELSAYLDKVRMVAEDVTAGRFYRRPGKWCGYCDFLPVCVGDKARAQETLVRIAPAP